MKLADLSDDAVIELAREGGVAWIPALSGMRKIVVAKLNEQQKQRIATILQQSLPLGKPPGQPDSPGRGDQRFFRIQIVSEQHYHSLIILIPGDRAPDSLVELWRDGEGCVSDKD